LVRIITKAKIDGDPAILGDRAPTAIWKSFHDEKEREMEINLSQQCAF